MMIRQERLTKQSVDLPFLILKSVVEYSVSHVCDEIAKMGIESHPKRLM
jgi:hypothetical protein